MLKRVFKRYIVLCITHKYNEKTSSKKVNILDALKNQELCAETL